MHRIKKMTYFWWFVAVSVGVAAFSLPYGLSWWVREQEPQWRARIQERLGSKAVLSPIQFAVDGLTIRLAVDSVRLGEGSEVLAIEGRVDWIRSLWERELQVSKIAARSATLHFLESDSGWRLGSLALDTGMERAEFGVSAQFNIEIGEVDVTWTPHKETGGRVQLGRLQTEGVWSQGRDLSLRELSAHEVRVEAKSLWESPRTIELVKGEFELQGLGSEVVAEGHAFWTDGSHAKVEFKLGDKDWGLDVSEISGEVLRLKEWIPYVKLSTGAQDWLRDGLRSGVIDEGKVQVRGSGEYEVDLTARSGKVRFHPEWSEFPFESVKTRISKNALQVDTAGTQYLGADIQSASVRIENLSESDALELDLKIRGVVAELEAGLNSSPIKKIGSIFEEHQIKEGILKAELVAKVPLRSEGAKLLVKGALEVPKLTPKGVPYDVQNLKSEFEYSEEETTLRVQEAQVLGGQWSGELTIQKEKVSGLFDGQIKMNLLAQEHRVDEVIGDAKAAVKINTKNEITSWTLSAETQNLKTKLPDPLRFEESGRLKLELHSNEKKEWSGELHFREQKLKWLQTGQSYSIDADLRRLDVEGWRQFLNQRESTEPVASETEFQVSLKAQEIVGVPVLERLSQAEIKGNGRADRFEVIAKADQFEGRLGRLGEREWRLGAERLVIQANESETEEVTSNIETWPFGEAKITHLQYGDKNFRNLTIRSQWESERKEYLIQTLRFDREDFSVELEPSRMMRVGDEKQIVSELAGAVNLNRFKYGFKEVKALESVEIESGQVRFQVQNPDVPWKLNFKEMKGIVSLSANQGKLLGIRNFATRAINFLSFARQDTLTKKIQFAKLTLFTRLKNGVWILDSLRGLFGSVYLRIGGTILLQDFALDLKARVTPQVTDLYDFNPKPPEPTDSMAVQILQEQKDPSTWLTHQYRIEGTLINPDVGLKVF